MTQDAKLVLHIGAPKCGSSSIQTALSKRPVFHSLTGRVITYCAIQGQSWIPPAKIRLGAKIGFSGYVASHGLHKYGNVKVGATILQHHAPRLSKMLQEGVTPVLSCEGWLPQTPAFTESRLLADLPAPTHVILFVRAPLDWLNSAWWQWGAWQEADVPTFLEKNAHRAAWVRYVEAWKAVPGVERVSVRLIQRGATSQFYELLDSQPPPEIRSNAAVPPPFLQLMLRNRHLRPDAESPEAEFIVGARIGSKSDRAVWALPSEKHAALLAELEPDTHALLEHLEPDDRATIVDDPAWWDATHYADREPVSAEELSTPEVLIDLYRRLCAIGASVPSQETITQISEAAAARDFITADAPLLEMIDAIYARSWRWRATMARRRFRTFLGRAPLN